MSKPETKSANIRAEQQPSFPSSGCCEKIREAAYHKWESAGCPCCDGLEFWLEAEAEIIAAKEPKGETHTA